MRLYLKLLSYGIVLCAVVLIAGYKSTAEEPNVMEQVEMLMPVLKGDTWIKMNKDEKVSFIWGAGHIVSIEEVLARDNPDLKKSNTFVNKIMEAHNNHPLTMSELAQHIDEYYQQNPDKLDKPVVEVIWYETVVPRLPGTNEVDKAAN